MLEWVVGTVLGLLGLLIFVKYQQIENLSAVGGPDRTGFPISTPVSPQTGQAPLSMAEKHQRASNNMPKSPPRTFSPPHDLFYASDSDEESSLPSASSFVNRNRPAMKQSKERRLLQKSVSGTHSTPFAER